MIDWSAEWRLQWEQAQAEDPGLSVAKIFFATSLRMSKGSG